MSGRPVVESVDVRSLKINPADIAKVAGSGGVKDLESMIPRVLEQKQVEVTLANVNVAISNGLRRTMCSELPTMSMAVQLEDIQTDDVFIIQEMILNRLKMIPVMQTAADAKFSLDAVNDGPVVRYVMTSEFKGPTGMFNGTTPLCTLYPGKYIKINNIRLEKFYGYNRGDGMCGLVSAAVSTPLDQVPINPYEPEAGGIRSSVSNPTKYSLRFISNGTVRNPAHIVKMAAEEIITRVERAVELLPELALVEKTHVLVVPNESDTIGNLFMRAVLDLYPGIGGITFVTESLERTLIIKILCNENPREVLAAAADKIIAAMSAIAGQLH